MAKRGGGSGRKYVRDAIGRFAPKGFSGQSSGRGARLKAKGKKRDGGGAIVKPKRIGEMKNTISKSKSKRKVNASSRATDRQIARDVAARAKKKSVTANSARATGKPAAAKPAAAKPAKRRGSVGKISEAKAGRIVARMDAQRGRKALPGRRNANFVRTAERRSQFVLKPAATARKKGKPISVNESVQKAVANAAKRRKAKPAAAKPAAAKRKSKKVSADKVDRIIGRLSKDPSRKESIGMSSRATKSRNTRETRTRALDFINKAAGLKLKGKGSRPENPKGLDRGQMVSNIAGKLAKPTKRSTLKNNSKVVAQRQQVRKSSREATASLRSSVKRQSRSAGPSYAPGRLRVMPPRVAAASGTRPFYTDNKGGIFSGRTSFGSTKASRQSKLQSVRKLRGTGGLGSSISQIKRSKASQKTIGGGTQITFGRFRTGFQKRRRS